MCELSKHVCGPQRADFQRAADKVPKMVRALNDNITAMVEDIRQLESLRRQFRDLLALIHCDGGHHTEAVGIEQSVEDAEEVWDKRQGEIDGLKQERDKWKACAESYLPGAKPVLTGEVCRTLREAADKAERKGE
jgi:hypothetical protein